MPNSGGGDTEKSIRYELRLPPYSLNYPDIKDIIPHNNIAPFHWHIWCNDLSKTYIQAQAHLFVL